jgi:hypothetical protein
MKKILILILICSHIVGCKISENIQEKQFTLDSSNSDFVGTWEFVKRLDKYDNKIDTIWHGQAYEIAAGPLTTFNSDGTYSKLFTPKHTNTGRWFYDSKKKILTQFLYVDSTDWIGKDLINRKIALKHEDNNYYEELSYLIIRLTPDTLQYLDYSGRNMMYKKAK